MKDNYRHPTDPEIAWMAGLFDGEGCIWFQKGRVRLMYATSDEDMMNRWESLVQCGSSRIKLPKQESHKPSYQWFAAKESDVRRLLLLMMPWFGERRLTKAKESLEMMRK